MIKSLAFTLLLSVTVIAQAPGYNYPGPADPGYNYDRPNLPPATYLPPSTAATRPAPRPTTTPRYQSQTDNDSQGLTPPGGRPSSRPPPRPISQTQINAEGLNPDGEHEPGMPFDFTYAVKDDVGNDFSHQANSDGDVVKGEYRTLLPDGRTQIVKYTADWKNGYNAEVTYEGEATYPEPPFKPENQEQIDSEGLYPSKQPGPVTTPRGTYLPPSPPQTTRRPPPPPPPPTTRRPAPPPPPPTTRRPLPPPTYAPATSTNIDSAPGPPPTKPPGLYGAPELPFGVRNNPKFGYRK